MERSLRSNTDLRNQNIFNLGEPRRKRSRTSEREERDLFERFEELDIGLPPRSPPRSPSPRSPSPERIRKKSHNCSLEDRRLVDSIMDDMKADFVENDNLKDFYSTVFGEAKRESTIIQKLRNSKTKIDFENVGMADKNLMIAYTELQSNLGAYMYNIVNPFTSWLGKIKRLDDIFTFKKSQSLQPWMLDTECIKECEELENNYYEKNLEMINAMSQRGSRKEDIDRLLAETIMLGERYIDCRVYCKEKVDRQSIIASAAKVVQSIIKFENHSLTTSFWLVSTFSYYYMFQVYYATQYLANVATAHNRVIDYLGNSGWLTGVLNKGNRMSDTQIESAVYSFITNSFGIESEAFALYYQTVGSYDGITGGKLTENQIDFIENNVRGIVELGQIPFQRVEQVGTGMFAQASYMIRSVLERVEVGAAIATGTPDRIILKGFAQKYLDKQTYFSVGMKVKGLFMATTLFSGFISMKGYNTIMGCLSGSMSSKLQVIIGVAHTTLDVSTMIEYVTSSAILYFLSLFVFYIGKSVLDNPDNTGLMSIKQGAKDTMWKAIPSVNNLVNTSQDVVSVTLKLGYKGVSSISKRRRKTQYCDRYTGHKLDMCNKCVNNYKLTNPKSIEDCINRTIESLSYKDISYKQAINECRKRGFKGPQLSYCIMKLRERIEKPYQTNLPDYYGPDYDPEEEDFNFGKRKNRKRVSRRRSRKRVSRRRSHKRVSRHRRRSRKFGGMLDWFTTLENKRENAIAELNTLGTCNGLNIIDTRQQIINLTTKKEIDDKMVEIRDSCVVPSTSFGIFPGY